MDPVLEDACILCSSSEMHLIAHSHSTLTSLNMVSTCNKYLSIELIGTLNKEVYASEKTWSTFCNTCFENSLMLSNLNAELEAITHKIKNHVSSMKQIITANLMKTAKKKKVDECVIVVENVSISNSEGTALIPENSIIVEESSLNVDSDLKSSKSSEESQSKAATLPNILRKRNKNRHKPVTMDLASDYSCKKCGESFERSSQLIMHTVNVHSKEKTFQCDICPRWFSSSAKVKAHKVSDHTISKYKCDFCEKSFEFIVNLEHHLEKHTETQNQIINIITLPEGMTLTNGEEDLQCTSMNIDDNQKKNKIAKRSSDVCSTVSASSSSIITETQSNTNLTNPNIWQNEETGESIEIAVKQEISVEDWSSITVKTEESD